MITLLQYPVRKKNLPLTPPRVAQKNIFFEKSKSMSNLLIIRVKMSQFFFCWNFWTPLRVRRNPLKPFLYILYKFLYSLTVKNSKMTETRSFLIFFTLAHKCSENFPEFMYFCCVWSLLTKYVHFREGSKYCFWEFLRIPQFYEASCWESHCWWYIVWARCFVAKNSKKKIVTFSP